MDLNSRLSWLQDSQVVDFFRVRQTAWIEFIKQNQMQFLMMIFFLFLALRNLRSKQLEAQKAGAKRQWCEAPGFPEIEQLQGFKWQDTAPIKLRTFKPKYYLTMGEFTCNDRASTNLRKTRTDIFSC